MEGWVKIYRELLEKAIWKTSTVKQKVILITLLLMASHKENEWIWQGKKFKVKAGQFVTSLNSIAENSGTSIQNVKTALKKFKKYGFLTYESTNTGRLVTITNWGLYQGGDNSNQQTNQQTANKQLTTIKNDKNERNIYSSDVEEIWGLYPLKKGKAQSIESIHKILKTISKDELIRCIKRYIADVECQRESGFSTLKYMNGSTFFKGRYEDYLDSNYKDLEPKIQINEEDYIIT